MATALDTSLLDPSELRHQIAQFAADSPASGEGLLEQLRQQLQTGRADIQAYFEAGGSAEVVHHELSRQMDAVIQGTLDYARSHVYGASNPTTGEDLAVAAVGGYGRQELAPGSDIDLLFLCPYKRTPHVEQVSEFLLYKLWDLGLKVGQAVRSVNESLRLAKQDLTVRTALLESRLLWGSPSLFAELQKGYEREIVQGRGAAFAEAKLAERDQRHQRMGDSRFMLEPNIKDGKGGLRDLQTLLWIGRFIHRSDDPAELVRHGLFTRQSLVRFLRSRRFLWTVRCHLHYLTGRPEDRLTFDLQPEIARRMGYRERNRVRAVERFMKRYYLVAKDVGDLTRILCARLEEDNSKNAPRGLARLLPSGRKRAEPIEQGLAHQQTGPVQPIDILANVIRPIGEVVYEEVRRHMGVDAAHVYGGLMATLTAWCEGQGIAYAGVPVGTINPTRSHTAGKLRGSPADGVGNHWWYQLTAADFQACQLPDPAGRVPKPGPW